MMFTHRLSSKSGHNKLSENVCVHGDRLLGALFLHKMSFGDVILLFSLPLCMFSFIGPFTLLK